MPTAFGEKSFVESIRDYMQGTNSKDVSPEEMDQWRKENMPGGYKSPGVGAPATPAPVASAAAPAPAPTIADQAASLPWGKAVGVERNAPAPVAAPAPEVVDPGGVTYDDASRTFKGVNVTPGADATAGPALPPAPGVTGGMSQTITDAASTAIQKALKSKAPSHNLALVLHGLAATQGVEATVRGQDVLAKTTGAAQAETSAHNQAEEALALSKLNSEDPMWQAHTNYYNMLAKAANVRPEEALKLQRAKDYDSMLKSDIVLADMSGTDDKDLAAKSQKWQNVWNMMHPDTAKGPAKPPITGEQARALLKEREAAKKPQAR